VSHKRYRLRSNVEAYEVARIDDGRREFIVNGSVVIEAAIFRALFVLDEPVAERPTAPKPKRGRPAKPAPRRELPDVKPPEKPQPKPGVNYSDLVREGLKLGPMTNADLRQYVAAHGDPDVTSETISSVLGGLRRRGAARKRDEDLRWVAAPKPPDVAGEALPGLTGNYRDIEE
jgi:hypothetical protein